MANHTVRLLASIADTICTQNFFYLSPLIADLPLTIILNFLDHECKLHYCITGRCVKMLNKTSCYNWGKVIKMKSSVLLYSTCWVKVYDREIGKRELENTLECLMSQKTGAVIHSLSSNLDLARSSKPERSFLSSVLQIHWDTSIFAALPSWDYQMTICMKPSSNMVEES